MALNQGRKNAVEHSRRGTKNLECANGICSDVAVFAVSPLAFLSLPSLVSFPMLCFGLSEMTY